MGSTVKMSSPPMYMSRAFEGLPCDQLSEGQKARVWLTDGSACHASTTQKRKAAVLQTLSGITLKDTSEEGVFTVGRTSCRTHGLTFFWRKKWPDVQFTDLWVVVNGLAGWLARDMEKSMTGMLVRKTCGEDAGRSL